MWLIADHSKTTPSEPPRAAPQPLRRRVIGLLMSTQMTVRDTTGTLLLGLCKSSCTARRALAPRILMCGAHVRISSGALTLDVAARLVKHVGYGPAAGYLVQMGLLSGSGNAAALAATTDGNDSEGEGEPLEPPPLLGGDGQLPRGHDMTDQEKEEEAERVLGLFAQLERTGVVRVVTPETLASADAAATSSEDDDG